MQGTRWLEIVRLIPTKLHSAVSFATVNGGEIMAQDILRLEGDFILLRGRMAGSQEAGKIIVLPYDQIVNLAMHKPLKDNEVIDIFGTSSTPPAVPSVPMSAMGTGVMEESGEQEHLSHESLEKEEPFEESPRESVGAGLSTASRYGSNHPAPAKPENPSAPKPADVSKSVLLARLRQRLAEQGKQIP